MSWNDLIFIGCAGLFLGVYIMDVRSRAYHRGWNDGFDRAKSQEKP